MAIRGKWYPTLVSMSKLYPSKNDALTFFKEDYGSSRELFRQAALQNPQVASTNVIPITAKGPCDEQLFIDLAWQGVKNPTEMVLHVSGTHGVEGFIGSAIQAYALANCSLKPHQAILYIHGLNPFGMAHLRRVTENNVDLNRNLTSQRTSPKYADKIQELHFNASTEESTQIHLEKLEKLYGAAEIRTTLIGGQYDYPEGLFYGGKQIEEGPQKVLAWIEDHFRTTQELLNFAIIDVHSGLGAYAADILITPESLPKQFIDFFGNRISLQEQEKTVGYRASGIFTTALKETICKTMNRTKGYVLGQEFGTFPFISIITGLLQENVRFHKAKRQGRSLNVNSAETQSFLRLFYPQDELWRQKVMDLGVNLLKDTFTLLHS